MAKVENGPGLPDLNRPLALKKGRKTGPKETDYDLLDGWFWRGRRKLIDTARSLTSKKAFLNLIPYRIPHLLAA
jgi:hypothetical protein